MSPHERLLLLDLAIGLVALAVGLAVGWLWGRSSAEYEDPENVFRLGSSEGRIAELAGLAAMPASLAGPEHPDVPRPDGLPLGAGPGHTYAELTAIAGRDDAEETERTLAAVAEAEAAVDPEWHAAFLVRSDAWLAEQRANLGLVA